MKDRVKNFIEIIRRIKMTEEENEAIRAKVAAFAASRGAPAPEPRAKTPSPYFRRFSFVMAGKVVGFAALFVIIGVSGLSYASASALPGDLLYPIKLSKEKLEERFVSTPEQKIALKQKRIETRFKEVETLIKEKKITPENRSIAEAKIQEDKEAIGNDLEEINKADPQAATLAKTTLDASIEEHQEKIDDLMEQSTDTTNPDSTTTDTDTDADGDAADTSAETDFDGENDVELGTTPDATTDDGTVPAPADGTDTDTPATSNGSISQDLKVTPDAAGTGTANTTPAAANANSQKGPKAQ
ncbi:MAG: DUF5667 domain-containing protein [bacterium]